jgi:hypothetical protein
MTGQQALLIIHIAAGGCALLAALIAFSVKTADRDHRWHVYSGLIFFASMIIAIVTALPLAILSRNAFLFFIALFSFYLAWSGWRFARRRGPSPKTLDRGGAAAMAAVALLMIGYGLAMIADGNLLGIALAAFGGIGGALCIADLWGKPVNERSRISGHLTRMLAATIATITAFLVTNVRVEPAIVFWLLPTVVITPVIYWWNRRIFRGYVPRGMRAEPGRTEAHNVPETAGRAW